MIKPLLFSLSSEQAGRMSEWAELWIQRGLSTEEADWESFRAGARRCYKYARIPWPNRVIQVGNPLILVLAGTAATRLIERDTVSEAVRGAVGKAVSATVRGTVGGDVRGTVGEAVGEAVDGAVGDAVSESVHGAVRETVNRTVRETVSRAVREAVGGAVNKAVIGTVREAVSGAARGAVDEWWWKYLGGCWWLSWQAYTSFFRDVCALPLSGDLWDRDRAYAQAQQSAGWWWPHRQFVMVTDRPCCIRQTQVRPAGFASHLLHSDDGPAIAWRDGWKLYFLNGVHVPRELVMTPANELDSVHWVAKEPNAEVRREAVRKIGIERVCQQLHAKVIDRLGEMYELLMLDLRDGRRRPYLKMRNPSVGIYHIEGVPPTIKTVKEALTWRNGTESRPEILT